MAGSFDKIVTPCEVKGVLNVPARFHRDHGGGGHQLMVMNNHTQRMYEFVLSARPGRHPKPVFRGGWHQYSRDEQLQAGQKLYFWKNDNEDFYRIQVERDLLGAGLL